MRQLDVEIHEADSTLKAFAGSSFYYTRDKTTVDSTIKALSRIVDGLRLEKQQLISK